jgi:hypothetical protein
MTLGVTFIENAPRGVGAKLIHLAGRTGKAGGHPVSVLIWRLTGLLVVTLLVAYGRCKRSMPNEPTPTMPPS